MQKVAMDILQHDNGNPESVLIADDLLRKATALETIEKQEAKTERRCRASPWFKE